MRGESAAGPWRDQGIAEAKVGLREWSCRRVQAASMDIDQLPCSPLEDRAGDSLWWHQSRCSTMLLTFLGHRTDEQKPRSNGICLIPCNQVLAGGLSGADPGLGHIFIPCPQDRPGSLVSLC